MGQQQLLLLVLGIVIVGLAVVVGIQAFGENQKKANSDALVNDGVRIASDAQAWALKPQAFGGPATTGDFTNVSFAVLGYDAPEGTYTNLNGDFKMAAGGGGVQIVGCSLATSNLDNVVTIDVTGTEPNSITTAVSTNETCPTPTAPGGGGDGD